MKKYKYSLVWFPIIGIFAMFYFTKYGRYNTIYFAGSIWQIYQFLCFFIVLINY